MGVFMFVCKSTDGVWSAKQPNGDLEASDESSYGLQRKLVKDAVSRDSGVVIVSGPGTGSSVASGGCGAPTNTGDHVAAVEAPAAEEKKEEKEESDDDLGGFFDDLF
ncbi:hypothetical protein MKW94_008225 [Papaver nudicaule]|uniref:60S acidic ribosomal protein P3 n=1 Tax=Papaver nudicaule TaxID=74823 RepID=A0AA41SCF1_PAPNU|nr:hypothetical protein [Papaver nudicaule]